MQAIKKLVSSPLFCVLALGSQLLLGCQTESARTVAGDSESTAAGSQNLSHTEPGDTVAQSDTDRKPTVPLEQHEIALSVDTEDQPADLSPGDRIDIYGAIRRARTIQFMIIIENVEVVSVGARRVGDRAIRHAEKYSSITIYVAPNQVPKLFDIQNRLPDQEFKISLRAPNDTSTQVTGGAGVINPEVLEMLGLD